MHKEFSTIQDLITYAQQDVVQQDAMIVKGMYCFGRVSPKLATAISIATGMNCSGYRITIDYSAIRHVLKTHGGPDEGKRGQVPIEPIDILELDKKILSPDYIEDAGKKPGQQLLSVKFILTSSLGTTTLVLTIHPGRRRQHLALKTMYKTKGQSN